MPSRFFPAILLLLVCAAAVCAQETVEPIEIKTLAGLRFDPPRFVVKPGAKVKLEVENVDDMAHNFVVIKPGARMEVVNAAMAMPITPEQTFIPPSDRLLHHTPVLVPGKSATLEFTAPAEEGVYPYICTYPGHGMVMFGAMYVTNKSEQELPLPADDENLPDMIREQAKNRQLHAYPAEPPFWYRIFMRDSGPASIAVALPGGQSYCWDTHLCRLRYVWRGGFVDPLPHWRGNGDGFAEVKGTIYYRPTVFPLRFNDWRKAPSAVQFRGYDIVDGLPEFRYSVDGVEVRERIKAQHHGGIETTFQITGAKSTVYFVAETGTGVEFSSDFAKFYEGVLKIPVAKAKKFTVFFTEVPNREPVGYWSMDDQLTDKKPLAVPGLKGRALVFDGKKSQFATGIKTEEVVNGATFAVWAQLAIPASLDEVCIGAKNLDGEFALGANLQGVTGYGVRVRGANQESRVVAAVPLEADDQWHHFAATLEPKGLRFFLDGRPAGMAASAPLPAGAEFYLGSSGKTNFTAVTLDEARIYARVLDDKEIAAIYESEKPKVMLKPAAASPPKPMATPAPETATKPAPKAAAKPTLKTAAKPAPKAAATPLPKPPTKPAATTKSPAKKAR